MPKPIETATEGILSHDVEVKEKPVPKKKDDLSKYGLELFEKLELVRRDPHADTKTFGEEGGKILVELYSRIKTVKISQRDADELNTQTINSRFVYVKEGQDEFNSFTHQGKPATFKIVKPRI